MATDRANDLRAFRDFANAKLSGGGAELTLEEALDLWEYENSPEEEKEETVLAIQRGLDDMHAGRTVDAFESAERLRRKASMAGRPPGGPTLHSYSGYAFAIEYDPDDPIYIVDFPDIPTIITSGSTLTEAFGHACEALDLYLEALDEVGRPHPEPRHRLVMEPA